MHSFTEYYMLMERIGWRLTDCDFEAIDMENITDADRRRARDTAITESAVPHYIDMWGGVEGIKPMWELRQFAALWAGEEHRHSEGLRLLCEKLEVDAQAEFQAVEESPFVATARKSCPSNCYSTISGLLTYTTIQELVTYRFYRNWAKDTKSVFLQDFLGKLAADEMRHHQWFANALQRYLPLVEDQQAYRQGIVDALAAFHMPHSYFPVEFPYFDARGATYFGEADFQSMKEKIVKIVTFDEQLTLMLLQIGEEALTKNLPGVAAPAA